MLWKCRGAYFKIPLTFGVLFSTFAYCHSKETLQRDREFLHEDAESQYLREVCFLNDTIADYVLSRGSKKAPFIQTTGSTRYSKEQNKQSQTPGLPQEENNICMLLQGAAGPLRYYRFVVIWGVPVFPCWHSRLCGTCVTRQ